MPLLFLRCSIEPVGNIKGANDLVPPWFGVTPAMEQGTGANEFVPPWLRVTPAVEQGMGDGTDTSGYWPILADTGRYWRLLADTGGYWPKLAETGR